MKRAVPALYDGSTVHGAHVETQRRGEDGASGCYRPKTKSKKKKQKKGRTKSG